MVVGGGVASGFFSSPGRWGASPSPQEKEQSAGSGNQGDSAPMGAGDLVRNPAWDGVGSGCQACVGDQAGSDSVERAGPDSPSPGRCFGKYGVQSTVCLVAGRGACMSVWFVCPRVTGREMGPSGG